MNQAESSAVAQVIPVLLLVIALPNGFLHDHLAVTSDLRSPLGVLGPLLAGTYGGVCLIAEWIAIQGAGREDGLVEWQAGLVEFTLISLLLYLWVDVAIFRIFVRKH